jgi:2'-5' RNA ligase
MHTKRIFIAAEFSEEIIHTLSAIVHQCWPALTPQIHWVAAQQYHLTLKFIGDYPLDKIPIVQQQCRNLFLPPLKLPLTLCGFGVFPTLQKPTILWAGFHNAKSLIALQKQLDNTLQMLGILPEQRPFKPHLTLARIKHSFSAEQLTELLAPIQSKGNILCLQTQIQQITLYESILSRQGPIYKRIETFPIN